jgi:aldehyde dehydrogenase (NAD+)
VDPGYFYTPTLLTDVDPDGEIAQEEVDDDDAVRIANTSIYGLSGVILGGQDRALAMARRIRTGTFSINGRNYFSPGSPFGGYKQSGIGREMGAAGLAEFQESKTFATVVT